MTAQQMALKAWDVLMATALTGLPLKDEYGSTVYKDVTSFLYDWWPSYMPWNPDMMKEAIDFLMSTRPIEEFGMIKLKLGVDMVSEFKLALSEDF